jgi:predicted transcriptional regulator of viral defense system
MQYIEFKDSLKDFTIFSLNDIRRIDNRFFRTRLNEWQNKGFIKKVIKGFYIFSDLELNEKVLFEIANRIYSPSYISFETALFWHGLIPESVYGITSASTRRTYKFISILRRCILWVLCCELRLCGL